VGHSEFRGKIPLRKLERVSQLSKSQGLWFSLGLRLGTGHGGRILQKPTKTGNKKRVSGVHNVEFRSLFEECIFILKQKQYNAGMIWFRFHSNQFLALMMICLALAGCGQADQANTHLGSIDQTAKEMRDELKKTREFLATATSQSERIADALVSLQLLAKDMVKLIQTTFVKKPAAQTDDIDAVIGAGSTSGEQS